MSIRSLPAVIVVFFIMLQYGCGKKTALVPPQRLVPVAINDLQYILDENSVTLQWTYPAKMENGADLQAIESFEIYRALIPEEEYCQGCPVQYEEPVEIAGGRLPVSGAARVASYTEGFLQRGYRYHYKVRSRAGSWYPSPDSNPVSFSWKAGPKAPQRIQIDAGDGSITLTWEPVTEDKEGTVSERSTLLYQVYRKSGEEDFAPQGEPVQEPIFFDIGLENETLYTYRVRALAIYADTLLAGGTSQVVSGMPRDLTPPPPPQHLVAVEIPGGVKLAWQAVLGLDLAGYRIYRRAGGVAKPEILAEVGPGQNQYIDRSIAAGGQWFYSVTTFDRAEPANESLSTGEAIVSLK